MRHSVYMQGPKQAMVCTNYVLKTLRTILAVVCKLMSLLPQLLPVDLVYRSVTCCLNAVDELLHLQTAADSHIREDPGALQLCWSEQQAGCSTGSRKQCQEAWAEVQAGDSSMVHRTDTHIDLNPTLLGGAGPQVGCQFSLCTPLCAGVFARHVR